LGEIEAASQESSTDKSLEYRFWSTTDYVGALAFSASLCCGSELYAFYWCLFSVWMHGTCL